jgi:hypothetical protein
MLGMSPPETDHDLRSRVVSAEHTIQSNSQRLTALEAWQRQCEIGEAKRGEQWSTLQRDLVVITKSISEVQGTLRWIGRTIIGAILVAAVAFMVKGGLTP